MLILVIIELSSSIQLTLSTSLNLFLFFFSIYGTLNLLRPKIGDLQALQDALGACTVDWPFFLKVPLWPDQNRDILL